MKEITIKIPDNCELKQDGNTYTIVEKEEKLTYEDVAKKLFDVKGVYWIGITGSIEYCDNIGNDYLSCPNNASTKRQAGKLLSINQLMNVATYLNGDWQPDWNNPDDFKYYIYLDHASNDLYIDFVGQFQSNNVYFKSEALARQAIEILSEETIKLALCTDY